MKKLFTILAVATLLVAAPANAQLKFGLKGGLNINNVKLDKSIADADNQTGFFIGPMAEFTIPIVGVGAEVGLLYNNKSMKIGAAADQLIAGETGFIEDKETLQYIDIPINFKYTLGIGSKLGVYAATGPQFSFNIGGKKIFDQSYSLKSSEFSWNIGAGVKLLGHLQIGYNFNIALGNTAEVDKNGALNTVTNTAWSAITGDLKNNTHQISVAWIF